MFVFCHMYVLSQTLIAVHAQTGTDAKNLFTYLFTTNAYNKKVRPLLDQTQPVTIEAEFMLNSKCQHFWNPYNRSKCRNTGLLSILDIFPLQKKYFVTKICALDRNVQTHQQQDRKSNIKILARAGNRTQELSHPNKNMVKM